MKSVRSGFSKENITIGVIIVLVTFMIEFSKFIIHS
jgi:hypothetical protein